METNIHTTTWNFRLLKKLLSQNLVVLVKLIVDGNWIYSFENISSSMFLAHCDTLKKYEHKLHCLDSFLSVARVEHFQWGMCVLTFQPEASDVWPKAHLRPENNFVLLQFKNCTDLTLYLVNRDFKNILRNLTYSNVKSLSEILKRSTQCT